MPRWRRVQQVEFKQTSFTEPAVDPIPWRSEAAPMLWHHGEDLEWAQTIEQKAELLLRFGEQVDEVGEEAAGHLFIVWPGKHRTDIFLIDDRTRAAEGVHG